LKVLLLINGTFCLKIRTYRQAGKPENGLAGRPAEVHRSNPDLYLNNVYRDRTLTFTSCSHLLISLSFSSLLNVYTLSFSLYRKKSWIQQTLLKPILPTLLRASPHITITYITWLPGTVP
jgi:hypothetical protein